MGHHTKDKGDIGVCSVIADLAHHGVGVGTLLSEHMPFDLIAVSPDYQQLCRLSVKYRSRWLPDVLTVRLKSVWNDRHGTHTVVHDKTEYDAVAIYDPVSRDCYYVRTTEIEGNSVSLRTAASRNGQKAKVRYAADYRDPMRLFLPRAS
jgi:hypothetical protein